MEQRETRFPDGQPVDVGRKASSGRVAGPWTPAVHALLRHLEESGFEGAPRALGVDRDGCEMLTFIAGDVMPASLEGIGSDDILRQVAKLVKRYHDATATFEPPSHAAWQYDIGAPFTGEVICHNDLGPYNTVALDGRPVAFIDFDCAAPGPREWDIAHALWRFVPLYGEDAFGTSAERARRITVFCDAYGAMNRRGILAMIERRQVAMYETLRAWSVRHAPAFLNLWRDQPQQETMRDLHYFRSHRAELEAFVGY
jgi:aminoglycoside phosphotransferase (APT) family kinase protein